MHPIIRLALAIFAAGALWAGPDPFLGTWKLDLNKARYSPGPAPASSKLIIEAASVTVESTSTDGRLTRWSYKRAVGVEVDVTGDMSPFTIIENQVDTNTIEQAWNFKGQFVGAGKATLSKNGKLLFYTFHGIDQNGKPVEIYEVFAKTR